jgi:hypothetical protein
LKTRTPGTVAEAVTRIAGAVGAEAAGKEIGKSAALVYCWADPDSDHVPNILQAIALDAAYVTAGFGEPPIHSVYRHHMAMLKRAPHEPVEPMTRYMGLVPEVGDIATTILAALADGRISPNERAAILREIREAEEVLLKLRRDVEAKPDSVVSLHEPPLPLRSREGR